MFSRVANKSWMGPSMLGGLYAAGAASTYSVFASGGDTAPAVWNTWPHTGLMGAFDTASLRRGYEVYRQVCSSCHSMNLMYFRHLIGVTHTEDQVKLIAKQYDVVDGPDQEGEMFERPGKPVDHFPPPYKNENAARAANAGALPPDLSVMAKARHEQEDYIFALLTGYNKEPPAGYHAKPGLYYNPYFDGNSIAMAPPLNDGQVEYEDDTPATVSQMAKDVCCFLKWSANPDQDERKRHGCQFTLGLLFLLPIAGYIKRFRWASIKSRRVSWVN